MLAELNLDPIGWSHVNMDRHILHSRRVFSLELAENNVNKVSDTSQISCK